MRYSRCFAETRGVSDVVRARSFGPDSGDAEGPKLIAPTMSNAKTDVDNR
jgi:hypothetical protein